MWIRVCLVFLVMLPLQASAKTNLGLHVTDVELHCWKQRSGSETVGANGITCPPKYVTAGDVQTNSPAAWTDVVSRKNTFNAAPAAKRMQGKVTAGCVHPGSQGTELAGLDPIDDPRLGENILHAAFYAMVANDATTAVNVRNELLAQAAEPGATFSDGTRWCKDSNTNDADPFFMVAVWQLQLFLAYDYLLVRDAFYGTTTLSAGNKTTLDTWFQGIGGYMQWVGACGVPQSAEDEYFVDRTGENYALTGLIPTGTFLSGLLYFGSPIVNDFHSKYNNRRAAEIAILGHVAAKYGDPTTVRCAKRWWKEWLRYGVWSDGTPQDFVRWETGGHSNEGWGYTAGVVQEMAAIADAFARKGDMELITYSTTEGTHGSQGGPKTLKVVVDAMMKYADHTIARYASSVATTDPTLLIDMRGESIASPEHFINDTWMSQANMYFWTVDQAMATHTRSVYLRQAPDQFLGGTIPAYPPTPTSNTYAWGGAAGTFPPMIFMWGQLEDVAGVNPYVTALTAAPTVTITAPNGGVDFSTSLTPLTTLAGGATDDVGVTGVTWSCPTCTPTSGTATCTPTCGAATTAPSWTISSIGLTSGPNVITVAATDAESQTATDTLTVTFVANATPVLGITTTSGATTLTPQAINGTATDDVGVAGVTWACPTCTPSSGTASCTPACGPTALSVSWITASIGLALGANVITVTASDSAPLTHQQAVTLTLVVVPTTLGAPFGMRSLR